VERTKQKTLGKVGLKNSKLPAQDEGSGGDSSGGWRDKAKTMSLRTLRGGSLTVRGAGGRVLSDRNWQDSDWGKARGRWGWSQKNGHKRTGGGSAMAGVLDGRSGSHGGLGGIEGFSQEPFQTPPIRGYKKRKKPCENKTLSDPDKGSLKKV